MVLTIDNYDSFTYNIVHYLREIGATVVVKRNDEIDIAGIQKLSPSHLIVSPGPGNPDGSAISLVIMKEIRSIPILGICLGHQCLGQAFGGKIVQSGKIYHGKDSQITHEQQGIFKGIPSPFTSIRYHSLVIDKNHFPDQKLEIIAYSEDGEIMGVKHRQLPMEGIQFHPESIGSEYGYDLLRNFLEIYS